LAANAQNVINLSDANLTYKYAGGLGDTASYATVYTRIMTPNSTYSLWYNMKIKITEVSATTSTTIILKARMFPTDAWSTVTTHTYKGTGADTTVVYQEITTKKSWNQYAIVITPTTGKVKLTTLDAAFRK